MTQDYLVRWFREEDREYYISGLNRTLYDRYDEERFKWKVRDSPFSLGFVSVAVVEDVKTDDPVAFNSFLPLEVKAGRDVFLTVQGCDGFVDGEHRRRGLFQRTIQFACHELAGKGPEVLIGFNFLGATKAAQKAGSYVAFDINRWHLEAKKIKMDSPQGTGNLSLTEASVDEIYSIYQNWALEQPLIHFHRTPEYIRWRFTESPLQNYLFYKVELDGVSPGYVVASTVEDEDGSTELSVDEYNPPFREDIPFSATLGEILERHDDVVKVEIVVPQGAILETEITRMGFKVESEPRYTVIMKAISNVEARGDKLYRGSLDLTRARGWHITKSDIY